MKAIRNLLPVLVLFALVSCTPPPANDNCTSAESISLPATPACPNGDGATVTVSGTTLGATPGNPYLYITGCSGGGSQQAPAQDVWYSFVATGTILNLSINSAFATPNIGLWTGACSSLQGIDCARGNTGGVLNYTNTSLIPGQIYFIQVSGNTPTVSGIFTLIIDNDLDCNNCLTTPIATLTQPTCTTPTGTITITSPAPAAGITYSIDGISYTNTTGIFTGLAPNTYSVTAKNASGCVSAATSYTINAGPLTPVAPTATLTQPTCTTPTGTITITSPPPAAGITYSIDGINYTNTTGIFTGLAPNIYSVTVKNVSGCVSAAASYTINAAPLTPAAPTATLTQPTCTTPTGTITITSPAPAAGITYSIDGINYTNTTGIFSGLAPNIYSVTVKNVSGCVSAAASYTINAAPLTPAAPTATLTQPTCTTPTGTITITSPAPAAGITYSIDGINYTNTTGIFTGLAPNTYSATVKNASGCVSAATSYTINAAALTPAAPTATLTQPTCTTPTGTITITSPAPAAGITYSIDGINYTNTTGIFTGLAPNTYSVTVKNASGCISAATSYTINVAPLSPAAPTATLTQPTCTTPIGTITITSPAPAAGITYSIDGINYTNTTGIFSGLVPNTYSVTVKNASGCISAATSYTINAAALTPAAPTATLTQPTCTTPTGTITITSPAPAAGITYSIDGINYTNTTGIFTGLAPNTYSVTVKNASGCVSAATSYTINAAALTPAAPTATLTQPTCTTPTGTITITSPAPAAGITYSIDGINYTNTTGIFTGLAPNTYSVTVKNASGCVSAATSYTINATALAPAAPTATLTQPTCTTPTGTITIISPAPAAGITYSIDGINYTNTTGIFTGLAPNTYSVTVKNASGCVSVATSYTINATALAPAAPTATLTQPTCTIPTGTITITSPAPAAGITYSIDGINYTNTTGIFTGLAPNTYSVTVKNASGCVSAATSYTINATALAPAAPSATLTQPTCTIPTGTITITSPAPAAGITYSIDGINYTNTTGIFTGLAPNTYSVTVKNASGCISAATNYTINAIPSLVAPSVTIISSTTSICSGGSITFTATPTNGGITPTYQWMINGVNAVGQTASTFITSSLANGNTVSVIMTSNDPCANPTTAISNPITITTTSVTPSVTITSSSTSICSGGSVTFTATPTNGGSAPTYQWMINGVNAVGQTTSSFTTSSLTNGNMVSVVMSSNDPCANPSPAASNPITITTTSVTPSVSINASSASICSGGSVTFTATPTNGGSTPTYQWMINGVNAVGQTASSFTTSSLTNGNIVSVVMTSNDPCANPSPAASNPITITTTSVTPSVSINASSASICSGGSVTFTATPTNGGSAPTYQWMINGVNAVGQTASTFITSSLANGNTVSVIMTSNDPCANPSTATSNPITITTTSVIPSVSITSGSTSICSAGSVTFNATPTNGGSTPTYQWMINGVNVAGQTASSFTTSTLANGNNVSVVMTSNDPCANPATVTSNPITITTTSVTPSVSITSSTTSICSGGSVTFTAMPTNGGSTPTYQWMINGVNVAGQTASTFSTSTLTNGNTVSVMMTSNDPCANPTTATSNPITITTTSVAQSVSINASSTSICSGGSITFTTTPTNGGSTPTYQWMINGVNVAGQTASTFTSSTLANGNTVSVIMTSNDPCANPTTTTSNQITITTTSVTPSVGITSNSTTVCGGSPITFTATPTNGGITPTYQWLINGVNVAGQTASTFIASALTNGNVVSVMMTSNDPCAFPVTPVQSQPITINSGTPVLVITNPLPVCEPVSINLTASMVTSGSDAGLTYTYWQDAAATIGLSNPNAVALAGTYYIKAVSSGGCFTIKPVVVSIEKKINGIRYPTVNATGNSPLQLTARNQGTGYSYTWSPPTGLDFPNTKTPVFVNNTGLEYLITITSPAGCVTVDTLLVKIDGPVINGPAVFVPKAWSPNSDGHNDYLFPFLVNITRIKYFRIYDRWGNKVFETNIIGQGWNGIYNGKPQMIEVFTWIIEAEAVNGTIYKSSGTSVLLR